MEDNIYMGKNININGRSLNVKIKINRNEGKIYGYIGKAKVIWYYRINIYPIIKECSDICYRRIAKDYITTALIQNNVSIDEFILSCNLYSRDGNVTIEIDKCNFIVVCYTGWIRGYIDNREIVWDTNKYGKAIYVKGNNYKYCELTDKILQWIKDAGYNSIDDLIYELKSSKIETEESYYMPDEIVEDVDMNANDKYLNTNNIDELDVSNFLN